MTQKIIWLLRQMRRALHKLADTARTYRIRQESQLLRQQLSNSREFSFTSDWLTKMEEIWLSSLSRYANQPGLQVLEIGSYEGRSAVWLGQNLCTQPDSRLVCVDLFRCEYEVRFDHNISLAKLDGKIQKYKGPSAEELLKLQGQSFDVIYIDGSHRAADVLLDANLSWPMLKTGGTLIFDDYLWKPEKLASDRPQLAIDLFLKMTEGQWEQLHRDYQILIRKT